MGAGRIGAYSSMASFLFPSVRFVRIMIFSFISSSPRALIGGKRQVSTGGSMGKLARANDEAYCP